jgi:hypothetical protein
VQYLPERCTLLVAYYVLTIVMLVVTQSGAYYGKNDSVVIYNVLRGGGSTVYFLTSGISLSILRATAESITDAVASSVLAIQIVCSITYYWGCNPVAIIISCVIELVTAFFIFGLVGRDFFPTILTH